MKRGLATGIGAAGALAAAVTAGLLFGRQPKEPTVEAPLETRAPSASTAEATDAPAAGATPAADCIEIRMRLVEGMTEGCMSAADYAALRDNVVLGGEGGAAELTLASAGAGDESAPVRTCADYESRIGEGWFALSNADIRREEFFIRACGALAMLADAAPARDTHFHNGAADEADMESLAKATDFGLSADAPAADAKVTRAGEGVWKLSTPTAETTIFEIAHADFTGDGLGEILAYVSTGAAGGTARGGTLGLIEKQSADGPCAFTPRSDR